MLGGGRSGGGGGGGGGLGVSDQGSCVSSCSVIHHQQASCRPASKMSTAVLSNTGRVAVSL